MIRKMLGVAVLALVAGGLGMFGITLAGRALHVGSFSSDNFSVKGADLTVDAKDNIDVWGTVRGKLGWAFDRILIYGTGGLAWADINYKTKGLNHDTGFTFSGSDNGVRVGWTAGGGLAWAIDDQWSIGAEYLYVNFGKYDVKGKVRDAGGALTGEVLATDATPEFHSVKGFLNFKF